MCPPNSNESSSSPKIISLYVEYHKIIELNNEKEAIVKPGPQNHAEPHKLEQRAGHCLSNHEDHLDLMGKGRKGNNKKETVVND